MEIPTSPPSSPEAPRPTPRLAVWARRRGVTVGLTAVALLAGGGAAIAAGQPSTDTDASTPPSATAPSSDRETPGKRVVLGGLLHSESVVSDGNGGYVTRLTQVGTISSIDGERLTVVSEDGYQRSWTRNADTAVGGAGWSVTKNDDGSWTVTKDTDDLATGDEVMVVGTLEDDTATATRITTVPEAREIPGTILERLDGHLGGRPGGLTDLRDRLRQRFESGPGSGRGEMGRFELRMPGRADASAAVPAQPSWSTSPASST